MSHEAYDILESVSTLGNNMLQKESVCDEQHQFTSLMRQSQFVDYVQVSDVRI